MEDPRGMLEAEIMAKHFVTTKYKIGLLKGKRYKTWLYTPPKEKQILIETFKAILAAGSEMEQEQNLEVRNKLQP